MDTQDAGQKASGSESTGTDTRDAPIGCIVFQLELIVFTIGVAGWLCVARTADLGSEEARGFIKTVTDFPTIVFVVSLFLGSVHLPGYFEERGVKPKTALLRLGVLFFLLGLLSEFLVVLLPEGLGSRGWRLVLQVNLLNIRNVAVFWFGLFVFCKMLDWLDERFRAPLRRTGRRVGRIRQLVYLFVTLGLAALFAGALYRVLSHPPLPTTALLLRFPRIDLLGLFLLYLFGLRCVRPFWTEKYEMIR